jgi:hypothetical protein
VKPILSYPRFMELFEPGCIDDNSLKSAILFRLND